MRIQLKFFASVREALDCAEELLDVPSEVQTVAALREYLRQRGPTWAQALAEERALRTAFNHSMCEADTRLQDGAEVAFFPPVTGG